jgi:hypothetical protein
MVDKNRSGTPRSFAFAVEWRQRPHQPGRLCCRFPIGKMRTNDCRFALHSLAGARAHPDRAVGHSRVLPRQESLVSEMAGRILAKAGRDRRRESLARNSGEAPRRFKTDGGSHLRSGDRSVRQNSARQRPDDSARSAPGRRSQCLSPGSTDRNGQNPFKHQTRLKADSHRIREPGEKNLQPSNFRSIEPKD